MEPKNDDSLPDHGDDFVVESSNEAMLDEPCLLYTSDAADDC